MAGKWILAWAIAATCVFNVTSGVVVAQVEPRAIVKLRSTTSPTEAKITLGDIAEIVDSNAARRNRLKTLDLLDYDLKSEVELDKSFVEIRVQLAGFSKESVLVAGDQVVHLTPVIPITLTDGLVEEFVHNELCQSFNVPREEIQVHLINPFVAQLSDESRRLRSPRLEMVRAGKLPLGRSQLTIRVFDNERMLVARTVLFEIRRKQNIVTAATTLNRNQILQAEHLRDEIRFIDSPIDQLTADQLLGRRMLTAIRPGDVLTLRNVGDPILQTSASIVSTAATMSGNTTVQTPVEILVAPRDAVRLIAKKGNMTVTVPAAEALQAGQLGQIVRVRNVQSNTIVTGRVTARGEVTIDLP